MKRPLGHPAAVENLSQTPKPESVEWAWEVDVLDCCSELFWDGCVEEMLLETTVLEAFFCLKAWKQVLCKMGISVTAIVKD